MATATTTAAAPRTRRLGRLERPALTGVLVREIVNYSSYWRSATFSSTGATAASTSSPAGCAGAC